MSEAQQNGRADTEEYFRQIMQENGDKFGLLLQYDASGYTLVSSPEPSTNLSKGERIEEIVEELQLENIEGTHHEQLYASGDLQCVLRVFDERIYAHIELTDEEGILVSIQADLEDAVETLPWCIS